MSLDWNYIPLSGIVKNEDYFYDRDFEIKKIANFLEMGGHVAVIGVHGIGKSTILWWIYKNIKSGKMLKNWKVIYINLIDINKKKTLIQRMLNELNVPFDKSADYEELRNIFVNAITDKKVVLILDEFDKVRELQKEFDEHFRYWLRLLCQIRECSLLISMRENPFFVFGRRTGIDSPLHNIFSVWETEPFDHEKVEKYVQKFGIEPGIGREIYNLTHGHPRSVNFAIYAFCKWKDDPNVQEKFSSWIEYYRYLVGIYGPSKLNLSEEVLGPVIAMLSRLSLFLIGFFATLLISYDHLYSVISKVFHTGLSISGFHLYLLIAILLLLSSAVGYLFAYLGLEGLIKILLMIK